MNEFSFPPPPAIVHKHFKERNGAWLVVGPSDDHPRLYTVKMGREHSWQRCKPYLVLKNERHWDWHPPTGAWGDTKWWPIDRNGDKVSYEVKDGSA